MRLELSIEARAGKGFVPFLQMNVRQAHGRITGTALAELSVALVGDAEMSRVHARFLGVAGPTDVLTFPLDFDRRGRATCGEVVVCVPEARRQAKEHGTRVEHELLLYVLHGMLHLSGFDDRTDADHHRIHSMEDRILAAIGIGPTFMPEPPRRSNVSGRRHSKGGRSGRWPR